MSFFEEESSEHKVEERTHLVPIKEHTPLKHHQINHYKERIYAYNIEIESLRSKIEAERLENAKEEKALLKVEAILEHECKLFETMHHRFTQKIEALLELKNEYKESLSKEVYEVKYAQKEQEIATLLGEIEEREIALLTQELERINLSNLLSKKLKKEEELKRQLRALELEKNYFEANGLTASLETKLPTLPSESIVDTVIMDEVKA